MGNKTPRSTYMLHIMFDALYVVFDEQLCWISGCGLINYVIIMHYFCVLFVSDLFDMSLILFRAMHMHKYVVKLEAEI